MKKSEIFETIGKSPDEIYAFYNVIKILEDTRKFRKWLKDYHKIKSDKSTFEGYKFISMVAIRRLIDAISDDSSLNIGEDFTLFRAKFVGIPLEDIPNTCDKVVVLKNIWKYTKSVRKSKTWGELEKGIKEFDKKVLSYLRKILEDHVVISKKISGKSKDEVLRIISMFYTYIFLVDTKGGIPKGHYVPILKENLSQKYIQTIFEGYKFALQFLWYNLLKEEFERSCVKKFHEAENFAKKESIRPSKVKEKSIDDFFFNIREDIIKPIEKELGITFVFDRLLLIENKINKGSLGNLLSKKPKDPEYLTKWDKESLKKRLDYYLFWYPNVEILDTQGSTIFNGVPAFISTFIGSVEVKRKFGIKDKVYTIRFKHPAPSVKGNDYSYGVLIEAAGLSGLADYSGWIIFYDCCGDYSGFAGSEHALAEAFLKKYEREGLIEIREFEIDKKQFREFLADKIVSDERVEFIKRLKLETLRKEIKDRFGESKGMLLELLFYYALSKEAFEKIEWRYKKADIELDVIAKKKNEIWFVECKNPLEIREELLKKKVGNLLKNSEFKKEWGITKNIKTRLIYCFWDEPIPSTRKFLDGLQIEILVLKNEIKELNAFKNKDLSKLNFIFSALESVDERTF